jgi:hypothetical protein
VTGHFEHTLPVNCTQYLLGKGYRKLECGVASHDLAITIFPENPFMSSEFLGCKVGGAVCRYASLWTVHMHILFSDNSQLLKCSYFM